MTKITNIQRFFATVSADQIQRYLLERGWTPSESRYADAMSFQLPGSPGDDPYEIWIWASETHPKFRKRVPNVFFALSVIEEREPLDIANDVVDRSAARPAESPLAEIVFSFRLSHEQHQPLPLRCTGWGETLTIEPGEAIEVVVRTKTPVPPLVVHKMDEIIIRAGDGDLVELFQVASTAGGERPTVTEIVSRRTERSGFALAEASRAELARADFELEQISADATGQDAVRRQTAVVLAAVARQLPNGQEAGRDLLWQIATDMLGLAGLRLRILPNAREELQSLAVRDDVFSPRLTLDWLKDQAC